MQTAILNSSKQLAYQPIVENKRFLQKKKQFIVLGMGGSHLAADLLREIAPTLPLVIHSDYGLPELPKQVIQDSLIIASSYSGNTEEVIEGFHEARKKKLPLAVIAVGGKLIELSKHYHVPYIQLPNTGIQPRSALGFSLVALLTLTGQTKLAREVALLSKRIKPRAYEAEGKAVAAFLQHRIPVIYVSSKQTSVAYNWKIKINENAKIPAWYNHVPELNHNEMNGFDIINSTRQLSSQFGFIFLIDKTDASKNLKRMKILKKLYEARGLPVLEVELKGKTPLEKALRSLLVADWTSVYLAEQYGIDPEPVPLVEEFKGLVG